MLSVKHKKSFVGWLLESKNIIWIQLIQMIKYKDFTDVYILHDARFYN